MVKTRPIGSAVPAVVVIFAERRRHAGSGWIDLSIAFANDNHRRGAGSAAGGAAGPVTLRLVHDGAARR